MSVSFHESSVIALFMHGDSIYVRLNDVRIQEKTCNAIISVEGVTAITVDGEDVNDVAMSFSDGEVLTLDVFADQIYAIIQWNDFEKHVSVTRAYRVSGRAATIYASSAAS